MNTNNKILLNDLATKILETDDDKMTPNDLEILDLLIRISNIVYNNVNNDSLLPISDGVYDLLMVKTERLIPNYQVGSDSVYFGDQCKGIQNIIEDPITRIPEFDDYLYKDNIMKQYEFCNNDFIISPIYRSEPIKRRVVNIPHKYPNLVGTLDKCKFVLNSQARELGVFDDPNVRIFERDFIHKCLEKGVIKPDEKFYMVAELKYDGISVEAEVSDRVISARSRGDANADVATDFTPILKGYTFPRALGNVPSDNVFGMKFEAILTKQNLDRVGFLEGKNYANCRNAMTGIVTGTNGNKYRDYITLVPLATSLDVDRLTEIEFLNKYYTSGVMLKYAVLYGDYKEILFQVKRFTEEAQALREYLPFMYDGVVISFIDDEKIKALGRENSVNKYSMAIKFNPLVQEATFLDYSYTVGQNGVITPMIHYTPVEFYGTIHTKSSGHSYYRFKQLGLRFGDKINVTYTNDVMPYVSKPDIEYNRKQAETSNPIEFPKLCPCCGAELVFSEKSARCPNINCPEKLKARTENMFDKLRIKDFAGERLELIGKFHLIDLLNTTEDEVKFLGEINSKKFIERMNELKTKPIYDYQIIGALGFTGIAMEKWKLILSKYTLQELMQMANDEAIFKESLTDIKGIGGQTANIIYDEMSYFNMDLTTILNMKNVIVSKNIENKGKVIRFTGFRDKNLVETLQSLGHDAGEGAVSKKTDLLLIPCEGFHSTKTAKAEKDGIIIIPVQEFITNMDKYLK